MMLGLCIIFSTLKIFPDYETDIIIPDTAKEKPQRGTVVAVGPGKEDQAMTVKQNDTVLYGKYAGQEVNHNGEDFIIMREDDILLILE